MTMALVTTVEVGVSGIATIDFTAIPQTGTDLLIVLSGRNTDASYNGANYLIFNSDTDSSTQSGKMFLNNGGTLSGVNWTWSIRSIAASAISNTFGNSSIYISNYSTNSNKNFSVDSTGENNSASSDQAHHGGVWAFTPAVTSLKIGSLSGNFVQYSSASLYTITKGSGGATVS